MKVNNLLLFFLLFILLMNPVIADDFNIWVINFKKRAIDQNISIKTVDSIMDKAIYLPKVIEYDRYQPEFYEDTFTYISKRSNDTKVEQGIKIFKKNSQMITTVEKEFSIEKELLLALMGIETNRW